MLEVHVENVKEVLRRNTKYALKLKLSKCLFAHEQFELLGHVMDEEGVPVDTKKVEAIREIPVPNYIKDIRSFLGMVGYYRRFMFRFVEIYAPLHVATCGATPMVSRDVLVTDRRTGEAVAHQR